MKNKAIQFGLYSGILIVIANIILYLVGPRNMINYGGYIGWAIHLLFMFVANKNYRESLGGAMTFKEGFKNAWQIFAVASIFEGFFAYVLFNFVDSSLYELVRQTGIELAAWSCELSNVDPCLALQDAEKVNVDDLKLTIATTLFSTAYRLLIPGALFAAVISAMTKREDLYKK
ncbi:MAG: hypothetical protein ACI9XO_003370 [Paraglaciecola sp.]|jgi:hypothetical protein